MTSQEKAKQVLEMLYKLEKRVTYWAPEELLKDKTPALTSEMEEILYKGVFLEISIGELNKLIEKFKYKWERLLEKTNV